MTNNEGSRPRSPAVRAWVRGMAAGLALAAAALVVGYVALSLICVATNERPSFCFEVPDFLLFGPAVVGALGGGATAAATAPEEPGRPSVLMAVLVGGALFIVLVVLLIVGLLSVGALATMA